MNASTVEPTAPTERPAWARLAAAAAVGFIGIAGFEAALALGAPLGRAAWGGANTRLPTGLRIASGFAVVFSVLAASGGTPPWRLPAGPDPGAGRSGRKPGCWLAC